MLKIQNLYFDFLALQQFASWMKKQVGFGSYLDYLDYLFGFASYLVQNLNMESTKGILFREIISFASNLV